MIYIISLDSYYSCINVKTGFYFTEMLSQFLRAQSDAFTVPIFVHQTVKTSK